MTNLYSKRLIEVDLPIARISAHARREKSIRHGHISTLHIWWARRPLAACRAVICAALWPDPADELCPQAFRDAAVEQVTAFANRVFPKKITEEGRQLSSEKHCSSQSRARWEAIAKGTLTLDANAADDMPLLRMCLLDFIADFANWDNSTVPAYLETSRALTQAAHEALGGAPGTRPLVVDPFAGGGSIPLEALRVGADAFASDLNPVAVLLNKVVLEYIPKFGQRLGDEVRKWGQWVKEEAEKQLAEFYPIDPDGAIPIAYLWARTIKCEGPGCGKVVPLTRTFWLTKRTTESVALHAEFPADSETPIFTVKSNPKIGEVPPGTVRRGAAVCPWCSFTTPVDRVRNQLFERRGGADDGLLLSVVCETPSGRRFRAGTQRDVEARDRAVRILKENKLIDSGELPLSPNEPLPPKGTLGFRIQNYGMHQFGDLYNSRQILALSAFCKAIRDSEAAVESDTVSILLSLALGRVQDLNSSLSTWADTVVGANRAQNRVSMVWDYAEAVPIANAGGSWTNQVNWVARVAEHIKSAAISADGTATLSPAQSHPLPDEAAHAVITDPPYYDAFAYSDLSDLFLVWLKRAASDAKARFNLDSPESTSPKQHEIVVNPAAASDGRGPKDHDWFAAQMCNAMADARRVTQPSGLSVVVFAHKGTQSWESLLDGIVNAGWTITASWPIDTERPSRQRAQDSAALASSVHLVGRPRENEDGSLREEVGEWRDVLSELPTRIHEWMPRLAAEGVVGADAIFACLGPALEIFSRYGRVEKANGEAVPLREYLEHVWAAVSTEALTMIFKDADAAGLEPDARLTAMWLWTLGAGTGKAGGNGQAVEVVPGMAADGDDELPPAAKVTSSSGYTLEFDAARKIAQGLGIHLEQSERIVEVKGDKARLLPVSERTAHLFGKQHEVVTKIRARSGLIMAGQGDSQDERKEQADHLSFTSAVHRGVQERCRADAARRAFGTVHRRPVGALGGQLAVPLET